MRAVYTTAGVIQRGDELDVDEPVVVSADVDADKTILELKFLSEDLTVSVELDDDEASLLGTEINAAKIQARLNA